MGSLFGKVYQGLLGLSMLLLTSYTGNNAGFVAYNHFVSEQTVVVNCRLVNAFENDFEDIFASGIKIPILFEAKLSKNKKIMAKESFEYTVNWISKYEHWEVVFGNQNYSINTDDFDYLIEIISDVKIEFNTDLADHNEVDFHLKASLPKLYIPSIKKEVDLMLLWKMKSPEISQRIVFTGV